MPREAYLQYQAIDNDDSLDKDQKAEAQNAASFSGDQVSRRDHHALDLASVSDLAPVPEHSPSEVAVSREAQGAEGGKDLTVVASVATTPSITHSGLVYALGTIAYDFGDEARRDLFRQAMAPVHCDGLMLTSIPHDPRQMVEHLDHHPARNGGASRPHPSRLVTHQAFVRLRRRTLSCRDQPNAAAAPKRGSGPGTGEVAIA